MSDQIVELGDEVEDIVTGFRGIVTTKSILVTAEDRLTVRPPLKDGEIKDSHAFDRSCLKVVTKNKVPYDASKNPTDNIQIGDEVEDKLTGFKGIAVARHIFISNCVHISIQPPFDKKKSELPENKSFESAGIKILKAQKVKLQDEKPNIPEPSKPPGGPDTYMPSERISCKR